MTTRKKTVLFVTGTRAEWGLFESTAISLKKSTRVDLKVLVTGMHTQRRFGYTLNEVRKAMKVDYVVAIADHDDQLTALSKEIDGIGRYLRKHPVDAVLVIGDRDEPFAAATAALHLGIPIIHISGGDVSGPTVDEYLRKSITLFSDLHLVQTQQSKKNVLALGARSPSVSVVGSAGLDKLKASTLLTRKQLAKKYQLNPDKRWFLIAMHPTVLDATSIQKQINALVSALKKLDTNDEKIVLYPNSDEGCDIFIRAIETLKGRSHCHLKKHLLRDDYLSLMKQSTALIGNTSSGLIEAGYLKVPFVNIGKRQDHREYGPNVIFVDYDTAAILKGVKKAKSPGFQKILAKKVSPYKGGDVSGKIVSAIERFLPKL